MNECYTMWRRQKKTNAKQLTQNEFISQNQRRIFYVAGIQIESRCANTHVFCVRHTIGSRSNIVNISFKIMIDTDAQTHICLTRILCRIPFAIAGSQWQRQPNENLFTCISIYVYNTQCHTMHSESI